MTNTVEGLLEMHKRYIMSSIYHNTEYEGQRLSEYFGEPIECDKKGKGFAFLLREMVWELPPYEHLHFLKYRDVYEKYPQLYLRSKYYLVKIKDLCDHFDKYKDSCCVPVNCNCIGPIYYRMKVFFYDKETGDETMEFFPQERLDEAVAAFGYLLHFLMEYEGLLKQTKWEDYQALEADLLSAEKKSGLS